MARKIIKRKTKRLDVLVDAQLLKAANEAREEPWRVLIEAMLTALVQNAHARKERAKFDKELDGL